MVDKDLKKGTMFSIGTSPDSKWISVENLGKSRSVFDFRKLIKISQNGLKSSNFMDVGNLIWKTFHVGNFFQISTDVELIKRF
jgi:hypothetical protein